MIWAAEELGACLAALLKTEPVDFAGTPEEWIPRAAERIGFEAIPGREIVAPCILQAEGGFLAVVAVKGERLLCLDKSGNTREKLWRGSIDPALAAVLEGVANRDRIVSKLSAPLNAICWRFRPACSATPFRWLLNTGAISKSIQLIAAHACQYLVWLAAWFLLGRMSLTGHLDKAWLLAWTLLLATFVPCRAVAAWLQGVIPVLVGGELKRRILRGALQLGADDLRTSGIGRYLSLALETEALETLALGGGIVGLLAVLDLIFCGALMGKMAILLAAWLGIAVVAGAVFLRRFDQWSGKRLAITEDLVESMCGHRTRVAQLAPERWHIAEDRAVTEYLADSHAIDKSGSILVAAIPRGWLMAAVSFILPSIIGASAAPAHIALLLGAALLAYSAFDRLTSSFSEIAAAVVAWRRIKPLFLAAQSRESAEATVAGPVPSGLPVVQTERATFRYRPGAENVLESCSLAVWQGDRVLLEGASGSGKSTLSALLSGSRQQGSGLVLSGGLDLHSLGDEAWRDRIVSVPQFHDNYILTETLAFNLLLGRAWPPKPEDLVEAESVCRELGLGPLLERMPSGLMQMVGEGGWQLSHGEKSRIFIARALLQNAELTILDENFGALDPECLQTALECTLNRANALAVISHA